SLVLFIYFHTILLYQELNDIVENIEALAAGTGLDAGAVTPDKITSGAQTATVNTSQSTTGTSFTDLSTTGPEVTVTVPASGMVEVILYTALRNATANSSAYMSFAMSGENTVAASTPYSIQHRTPSGGGD